MSKRICLTLTSICVAAVLSAGPIALAAAAEGDKTPAKPKAGQPGAAAPAFSLTDHNGKEVSLGDYKGKIVVLEWINPDCPFSRRHSERGTMKGLAGKYAPKGVVWLAINSTHYYTTEKNKAWAGKYGLPYPILNDQPGDVGRAYAAKTTPDIRVIDAKGRIAYSGGIDDDPRGKSKSPTNYVAKALGDLLAGRKVAVPHAKPYGCSVKYAKPAPKPAAAGDAPGFTLTDQDGRSVSLADYAGKIVVLEWINPDCPFSRRHSERGTMKGLAETYASRGVVWLAINSTHYYTTDKNKAWATKYDLPYPILNDQPGSVGRAYGARTTPDMRIIDKSGNVVYSGGIDDDPRGRASEPTNYVARALAELVAGKGVSTPRAKPYGCSVKYAKKAK